MYRLILLVLFCCTASAAAAQDWQLVWSDEFETPGLPDPTRWNYDLGGHGWGNQERQHYTSRAENARVEGGVLVIEAREEEYQGNPYTSARLVTRGHAAWQYGRIEARMKLPFGQGIWPAFWMLPTDSPYGGWPTSGEIDIMEYLGHDTDRVYGTLHYGGGDIGHRFTGTNFTLSSGTFADGFHTFAIEWEPRRIRWFVDGQLYQTQVSWSSGAGPYPAPFDSPFHVLLNLAVGGEWPGYPDATTTFPQRLEVDYVRVYQDADAYPHVSLDTPTGGASLEAGATVSLSATATDGGAVGKVEFLQGDGVLGALTRAPYTFDVAGVADGCYALRARATDDVGFVTETAATPITVGAGCPEGSTAPYLMVPTALPGTLEAEYYDLGGPGVAYRDLSEANEGGGIRQGEGVDIRPSRDSGAGHDVAGINAREWLAYTVEVTQAGRYRVTARVASGTGGTLRLALDGADLLGDVALAPTGGDLTYGNALIGDVELPAGQHVLRLDARSAGFALNRLVFTLLEATSTEQEGIGGIDLHVTPNPARGRAEVIYRTGAAARVELALFDLLGRRVRLLASGSATPGTHRIELDLGTLAAGTYLCVLETEGEARSRHLTVFR